MDDLEYSYHMTSKSNLNSPSVMDDGKDSLCDRVHREDLPRVA
jgi:hypothetical protein